MEKEIAVLDADEKQCQELCLILEEMGYRTTSVNSIKNLEKYIQQGSCLAVFLDIDTVSIDNRVIRNLTIRNPEVYFFCLSKHRYNPELKEAICYHIYACLNKPVDLDELLYWLRSIDKDGADPKN